MEDPDSGGVRDANDELRALEEKKRRLGEIYSRLEGTGEPEARDDAPRGNAGDPGEKRAGADDQRLALTKQEILDFCDEVIERWGSDPGKDTRHVFAMNAVKTSVLWTEEDTLKEIWGEIIRWVFELLYKNAVAQGNAENMEWSKIMERLGGRT